jgi:SAM-dependent methyltransferase
VSLEKSEINGYYHKDDPGEPGQPQCPDSGKKRLSVNDEEARILATFCHGKRVLEIGTGLGVATQAIASVADYVFTVDIDPFVHETIFPMLRELGNVDCAKIPQTNAEFFDVAMIDGNHNYESVMQDIQTAHTRVKKGGILLFHDYHMHSVRLAIYDSNLKHFYVRSTAGIAVAWND